MLSFTGFVLVCQLGVAECTKDIALQVVPIPGTFTNKVSAGFAGVACQQAVVAYARANFDPAKNRLGVLCVLGG
jgi:hypothetical protein